MTDKKAAIVNLTIILVIFFPLIFKVNAYLKGTFFCGQLYILETASFVIFKSALFIFMFNRI